MSVRSRLPAPPDDPPEVVLAHPYRQKYVRTIARKYVRPGTTWWEDAVANGMIGLWKACLGFDPGRNRSFNTYAWAIIRNEVLHGLNILAPYGAGLRGGGKGRPDRPRPLRPWHAEPRRRSPEETAASLERVAGLLAVLEPHQADAVATTVYGTDGNKRQAALLAGMTPEVYKRRYRKGIGGLRAALQREGRT